MDDFFSVRIAENDLKQMSNSQSLKDGVSLVSSVF